MQEAASQKASPQRRAAIPALKDQACAAEPLVNPAPASRSDLNERTSTNAAPPMDISDLALQPASRRDTFDIWQSATFAHAAALLRARNNVRRAQHVVCSSSTSWPKDPESQHERLATLDEMRDLGSRLSNALHKSATPSIAASIVLKTDVDQQHPLSVDLGLAFVALGAKSLLDLNAEIHNSLCELRTSDIAALLQACARLGWDHEIDHAITAMRPGQDCGHLGAALAWRIRREPWRVVDHSSDWREQLACAKAMAHRVELELSASTSLFQQEFHEYHHLRQR